MIKNLFIILSILFPIAGFSLEPIQGPSEKFNLWEDTKHTVKLFGYGAYYQFREKNNLYYMGAAVPSLYWAFEEDDRVKDLMLSKEIKKPVDIIGDLGVVLNFPVLPLGLWYYGKKTENNRLRQFAMEYTATLYLALGESGLLSFIQVHERPTSSNISFWEEAFRGDSSWPSGHVIPYMALIYKTYQFFGPYWTILPVGLTYAASLQRMQDGKHWVSDIIGSLFLTAFAAEGVRAANGYHDNHPVYKWMFEHDFQASVIRYQNAWGPRISFTF